MNDTLKMVANEIKTSRDAILATYSSGLHENGQLSGLNWLCKDVATKLTKAEGHEFMLACGLSQNAANETLGKL